MSANPQPRPLVTGDLDLLISRSLDGDLPGEEERELRSLLATDASARARYDAMARLVGRLEELPDAGTPFALATRVASQVEADTRGFAATLHKYGFYFRPATFGVIAAGLVVVAVIATLRNPPKPVATVAEVKAAPAPPASEDRMTVYLATTEKPKEEAATPAALAAVGAPAEAKGGGRSEPVLAAKAEGSPGGDKAGFAPERDAPANDRLASATSASEGRAAAESAAMGRQEAEAAPARLRAAAPAPAPPSAERPSPRLDLVGSSSAGLRLAAPARLDGLAGPFDGSYRLELTASGRVAEVVRLFGGSGAEPPALSDRLRTLSFASSNGAPMSGPVDVRVRLP
ncbi:MAG: anti-sigma factor family protein [Thermoanaerobaculia bacterium]